MIGTSHTCISRYGRQKEAVLALTTSPWYAVNDAINSKYPSRTAESAHAQGVVHVPSAILNVKDRGRTVNLRERMCGEGDACMHDACTCA